MYPFKHRCDIVRKLGYILICLDIGALLSYLHFHGRYKVLIDARPQVFSIPVFAGPSIPRSDGDVFIAINEEQILGGIVGIQCCQGIPNIVPAAAAVRQGCSMGILDVRVELVAIG